MQCKYCAEWLGTNDEAMEHAGKCPALHQPQPVQQTKRMTAKYEGWCTKCAMKIYVGELIDFPLTPPWGAYHAVCPVLGDRPSRVKMNRYQMAIVAAQARELKPSETERS